MKGNLERSDKHQFAVSWLLMNEEKIRRNGNGEFEAILFCQGYDDGSALEADLGILGAHAAGEPGPAALQHGGFHNRRTVRWG